MKGAIRKEQLLDMVPVSEFTINKLEAAGEFPKRFLLTSRAVAWNRDEVEAWLDNRQKNPAEADPSLAAKFEANPNHQKRSTMRMAG